MWNEAGFINWFGTRTSPYIARTEQIYWAKTLLHDEPNFDFSAWILHFANLRADYPPGKHNVETDTYFSELDCLYEAQPLMAVKLAAAIFLLDNYSFDQFSVRELISRFERWFTESKLTPAEKIELGLQVWVSCYGIWMLPHFNQDILIPILMPLFLDKSKSDSSYIVEKFDFMESYTKEGAGRKTALFNQFVENPDDFLQFSRNIYQYKPKLLTCALSRCLSEGMRFYQTAQKQGKDYRYQPTEKHMREVAFELFEKAFDSEDANRFYSQLILEAYPDELWYNQLFDKLWALELANTEYEEQAIKRCFLVVMNSDKGSLIYQEAKKRIENWVLSFKDFYQDADNQEPTTEFLFWIDQETRCKCGRMTFHASRVIDCIDDAMSPLYPLTRNLSLPAPENHEVITMLIDAYWQMVDWLISIDINTALHVLVVGFQKNEDFHTNTDATNNISRQARVLFLNLFQQHYAANVAKTQQLLEQMINQSRFSNYNKRLGELLDEIFPVFEHAAPVEAKVAYENAKKNDSPHSLSWYYRKKFNV